MAIELLLGWRPPPRPRVPSSCRIADSKGESKGILADILVPSRLMQILEPIEGLIFQSWLVPISSNFSLEPKVMGRFSAVDAKLVEAVVWSPVGPSAQLSETFAANRYVPLAQALPFGSVL